MKFLTTLKKQLEKSKKIGLSMWRPVKKQVQKRPLVSFFGSLALLFGVIVVVNVLNRPEKVEEVADQAPKPVRVYRVGEAPTVKVQAKIEKTGVVTVLAQTSGVVQRVNVGEGGSVNAGQTVVSLSSTYGGANMASLQRQLAQKSYDNAMDTFDTQITLIDKRRELAEKTDENADKMRELARESLERTRNSLSLNEEILASVDANLDQLEALPQTPETDELILQTKQAKAQLLAGVNGLKDAVANVEASSDDDDPAARLSDLGREISQMGLELEEKGLRLSLEVAELNLKIARVGEMLYYPQTPVSGVVERVFVKPGDLVNPGQPIAAIAGNAQSVKAVALVGSEIAAQVSRFDTSVLSWESQMIEQVPQHVASEPTDGNLFAITWCQLDEFADELTNKEYITVELPVGAADTNEAVPFLPLDAIYQTQDEAYVFINSDGQVKSREVGLGSVFGSYVEVREGLGGGDEVILDRAVISGDLVESI